jgi:hypothetical protein
VRIQKSLELCFIVLVLYTLQYCNCDEVKSSTDDIPLFARFKIGVLVAKRVTIDEPNFKTRFSKLPVVVQGHSGLVVVHETVDSKTQEEVYYYGTCNVVCRSVVFRL